MNRDINCGAVDAEGGPKVKRGVPGVSPFKRASDGAPAMLVLSSTVLPQML